MAAAWLRPGAPESLGLLVAEGGAELQLQVQGYLVPHERVSPAESEDWRARRPDAGPKARMN